MPIQTKESLLERLKTTIGDDMSDDVISLIEDVTDTFDDMNNRVNENGDWKTKYETNDAEWRKRYKERFFNGNNDLGENDNDDDDSESPKTFDDLFK